MGTYTTTRPPRTACASVAVALLLAGCVAIGCSLRPQPEPPEAQLDPTRLFAEPDDATAVQPMPGVILGAPGAAEPPGAIVRAFNLDRADDPAQGVVQQDGSFSIDLAIMTGEEVRLQLHDGASRSQPIDVVIGDKGETPKLANRALAACLELEPALEAGFGTVSPGSFADVALRVSNRCDHAVDIAAPTLRRPVVGVTILDAAAWQTQLPAGSTALVTLRYEPVAAPLEEILFVEATAPVHDRRPITLWAGD